MCIKWKWEAICWMRSSKGIHVYTCTTFELHWDKDLDRDIYNFFIKIDLKKLIKKLLLMNEFLIKFYKNIKHLIHNPL